MSHDSTKKTIVVALGVCLVCSVLVSTAAVGLESIQEQNKKLDKIQNILNAGDIEYNSGDAEELYENKIEPVVIELSSGRTLDKNEITPELQPENFDIKKLSFDPDYGTDIDPSKDIAQIKRRPRFMIVYEVTSETGGIEKYIMPIYGKGLWSTMYGFIALGKDLKMIEGFTFYEHGETPGLGGEVDNPNWKKLWKGKTAYDHDGEVIIDVIKGKVDPTNKNSGHQIDGLSGATITTRGIDQLVKYWLGPEGYGPFVEKMREEGHNEEV
ncbi:MAG: Na(+)-translocating NADH-quinone reductase subunit C [Melioribacteraceae bacterium]|nr:Na(+)-translocating NADH-quinone reductase subunit C [Melioribacteraceae bacterium]